VQRRPIPSFRARSRTRRSAGVSASISGSFDQVKPTLVKLLARWTGSIAKALLVEPFGPSGGVIADADGAARTAHVDMVGEREIAKAKVSRDRADCLGKIVVTGKFADVFDEFFYAIEHPPRAAFRNAAERGIPSPLEITAFFLASCRTRRLLKNCACDPDDRATAGLIRTTRCIQIYS
jgi:hypothetical protein